MEPMVTPPEVSRNLVIGSLRLSTHSRVLAHTIDRVNRFRRKRALEHT